MLLVILLALSCSNNDASIPPVLMITRQESALQEDSGLYVYVGDTNLGKFVDKQNRIYSFISDSGFISNVEQQENGFTILGIELFSQQIYYEYPGCTGIPYVSASISGTVGFYYENYIYDYQPTLIMVDKNTFPIHALSYMEWGICWNIDRNEYVSEFRRNDTATSGIVNSVDQLQIEVR